MRSNFTPHDTNFRHTLNPAPDDFQNSMDTSLPKAISQRLQSVENVYLQRWKINKKFLDPNPEADDFQNELVLPCPKMQLW